MVFFPCVAMSFPTKGRGEEDDEGDDGEYDADELVGHALGLGLLREE